METHEDSRWSGAHHEQQVAPRNSDLDSANDDIHVVTENGEQCFMWRANQLTYIAQDRQELPPILATKFGRLATKLDLSYNSLTSFRNIDQFVNLSELILDNNSLVDEQLEFRQNLRLKTLSLNKNKLTDLHRLVSAIKFNFPNLEFLSLIGNPLCPAPVSSRCEAAVGELPSDELTSRCLHEQSASHSYEKYRLFVVFHLPNLRFLDSRPVDELERDAALRRCHWMPRPYEFTPTGLVLQATEVAAAREAHLLASQAGVATQTEPAGAFQMTIMSDYVDPLDSADSSQQMSGERKGAFSRLAYKYTGKNSEGNRFIRNHDL